jgi:hypothetical protein
MERQQPRVGRAPNDRCNAAGLNIDPHVVQAKLGLKKADDGAFWMLFEDLVKYFNRIDFCLLPPKSWSSTVLHVVDV